MRFARFTIEHALALEPHVVVRRPAVRVRPARDEAGPREPHGIHEPRHRADGFLHHAARLDRWVK